MPAIQTRLNKVGNFLKKELWPAEGYCRTNSPVDITASNPNTNGVNELEVGSVLEWKTNHYGELTDTAFTLTSDLVILVDDQVEEIGTTIGDATDTPLALMDKGPAQIRTGGLTFGVASAANIDLAILNLEAKGVQFVDRKSVYLQDFNKIA